MSIENCDKNDNYIAECVTNVTNKMKRGLYAPSNFAIKTPDSCFVDFAQKYFWQHDKDNDCGFGVGSYKVIRDEKNGTVELLFFMTADFTSSAIFHDFGFKTRYIHSCFANPVIADKMDKSLYKDYQQMMAEFHGTSYKVPNDSDSTQDVQDSMTYLIQQEKTEMF